jgi:hypothetical protein
MTLTFKQLCDRIVCEKRAYLRGNCFCEAEVIIDEDYAETEEVSVLDLAAGGIKFAAEGGNTVLNQGEVYKIRLSIHESDINIDDIVTDVKICRIEESGNNIRIYGAAFEGLTELDGIRLDEIIQHKKRTSGEFNG